MFGLICLIVFDVVEVLDIARMKEAIQKGDE
jgi:hypothetical protein